MPPATRPAYPPWLVLAVPTAAVASAAGVLWLVPRSPLAGGVEFSAVYLWWPVLVPLGAVALFAAVVRRHRAAGDGCHSPAGGVVAPGVAFLAFAVLATLWVPARSAAGGYAAALAFAAAAALLVPVWVACSGPWRAWVNRRVVGTVLANLARGARHPDAVEGLPPGRVGRVLERLNASGWGSPHCLEVVRAHYRAARDAVAARVGSGCAEPLLVAYFRAAEALVAYLDRPWSDDTPGDFAWETDEVRREAATLAVWFARFAPSPLARLWDQLANWTGHEVPAAGPEPTAREVRADALKLLFELCREVPAPPTYPQIIRTVLSRHAALKAAPELERVLAWTWLAVAPACLPPQLCLDVWDAFGTGRDPGNQIPPDVAAACARLALPRLYLAVARPLPAGWDRPLRGRYAHLVDAALAGTPHSRGGATP